MGSRPKSVRAGRLNRGDRGVTLVEGAIVAPLFLLLVFTVFEFGLAFRQYLTISTADVNATRTASAAGNVGLADFLTLKEFNRSTAAIHASDVKTVVVFKAVGPKSSIENDASLMPCLTASRPGLCNRYVASDLGRDSSQFGNCAVGSTSPDRFWCPTSRIVAASGPPDYVGVYVATRYDSATGIFGKSFDFSQQTIYRLEAQTR